MRDRLLIIFSFLFYLQIFSTSARSQPQPSSIPRASDLDLSPDIEDSPVLQRWREQVPNILEEITRDPSFRTRLRLGYSLFLSAQAAGITLGVEDVFIGSTRFTVSGEYYTAFDSDRTSYGGELRYYLRPLGSYINVAPLIGYRHLETDAYSLDGVNLGARLLLAFSRDGAADISLSQSWVALGTDTEVGLTTLSISYAITQSLRVSTGIQQQNSRQSKDSRVGIILEWMP
ncbi:hypothetical protein NIES1031_20180 [Chroogloeocystis siderophila 5.2 s.c.1]|jgi:hypothetical protein|uniref:Uncharacterized protein n=2 Tax=Chroogloeocystis TaxID=329162 RepID=A0A1U7HG30_9CHRO|nr:hypothetical protein NIES1031_20180 [Chroogloeocystis siderophila 5.2 s.c.1]